MSYSQLASAAYNLQHHHFQQQQHQQHQQQCVAAAVCSASQLLATVSSFLPQHSTNKSSTVSNVSLTPSSSDLHHTDFDHLRQASIRSLVGDSLSSTVSVGAAFDVPQTTNTMYGTTATASSLLAYPTARVAALTAATDYSPYSAVAAATGQPYVPFDSSAFYSPLSGDTGDTWRSLSQTTACGGWPYDPGMSSYPYGPSYGGLDVRRKNATRESTSTLKAWLYEHIKNPYPTKGEKIMLAIITKMTLTQVSTWFANARRRLKKENKMQWSPRNRTDNDDDDKSSSDENDDYNDNSSSTKCHDNGPSSRRHHSKDDDEDIIVDNPVVDAIRNSGSDFQSTATSSHRRMNSCSRLHQPPTQQSLLTSTIVDCHSSVDSTATRLPHTSAANIGTLRSSGTGSTLNSELVGGSGTGPTAVLHPGQSSRCTNLLSATTFMPTSACYYRPATPLTSSIGSSSYFQPNQISVSGLASADDDDNDDDEPAASSEEEENKPRIWSIADVATSCRPLQQRGGLVGGVELTSSGASGNNHNGFLHPWSNSSPSFNYTHYQSTGNHVARPSASTTGFYAPYYQQQHQHRPAAAPVARQQVQLQSAVPVGMETSHHHLHQQQHPQKHAGDAARCLQLQNAVSATQFPNLMAGNAYDMTNSDALSGQPAAQCIGGVSMFTSLSPAEPSIEPYGNMTLSNVEMNLSDPQTAFKPVVKRDGDLKPIFVGRKRLQFNITAPDTAAVLHSISERI